MATATTWGAAAKSGKPAGTTKEKDSEKENEVIEVSAGDYDVVNENDGDVITLTIMGQDYALDLETAGNLAEDLVDANPELEKTEQD